jgi:hypothetical protein
MPERGQSRACYRLPREQAHRRHRIPSVWDDALLVEKADETVQGRVLSLLTLCSNKASKGSGLHRETYSVTGMPDSLYLVYCSDS